jgi:hypothetical protein
MAKTNSPWVYCLSVFYNHQGADDKVSDVKTSGISIKITSGTIGG